MSVEKKSTKQVPQRAAKEQELALSQKLVKGLAHPLRVRTLACLNEREWSPNELHEELAEGLSQVSYHVKVLKDFELIELTRTEPRRGAVEHYYRAVERAFIPSGLAKYIPKSAQQIAGSDILREIDKDLGSSLKSGRFYSREDWHASWTPVHLDDEGCKAAEKLADRFVEDFLEIQAEATERMMEDDAAPIAVSAALLVFGSDHGDSKKAFSAKRVGTTRKKSSA